MKVRVEARLTAADGERVVVSTFDLPAPPQAGLALTGRGWEVAIDSVSYSTQSEEYRASGTAATRPGIDLEDLVRRFEMEGWRSAAR